MVVTCRRWGELGLSLSLALACACGDARPLRLAADGGTLVNGAPAECTRCHGYPPNKDAHYAHAGLAPADGGVGGVPEGSQTFFGQAYGCEQCHKNVQRVTEPDHIVRANGQPVPRPAEVRFDDPNALAAGPSGGARAGPPSYDPTSQTCSNVYCHGATLRNQVPGLVIAPRWSDAGKGLVGCGSCHGIPPANHQQGISQTDCYKCHAPSIDAQGRLSPQYHINGRLELGGQSIQTAAGSGPEPLP